MSRLDSAEINLVVEEGNHVGWHYRLRICRDYVRRQSNLVFCTAARLIDEESKRAAFLMVAHAWTIPVSEVMFLWRTSFFLVIGQTTMFWLRLLYSTAAASAFALRRRQSNGCINPISQQEFAVRRSPRANLDKPSRLTHFTQGSYRLSSHSYYRRPGKLPCSFSEDQPT